MPTLYLICIQLILTHDLTWFTIQSTQYNADINANDLHLHYKKIDSKNSAYFLHATTDQTYLECPQIFCFVYSTMPLFHDFRHKTKHFSHKKQK